jgi:hypothetical protein
MEKRQFMRTAELVLVLGVTGLAGGCGPSVLSPTDQVKVDAAIKKDRVGRHQELNAAKQAQGSMQRKQAAGRKVAQ